MRSALRKGSLWRSSRRTWRAGGSLGESAGLLPSKIARKRLGTIIHTSTHKKSLCILDICSVIKLLKLFDLSIREKPLGTVAMLKNSCQEDVFQKNIFFPLHM